MGCYAFAASMSTANMADLLDQAATIQAADVVIAVTGADPALPAVLAGLVDAPIVAVPTSAGAAGSSMGGVGALVGAAACAPCGVSIVPVDDGVAAAGAAARVLRMAAARVEKLAAAHAAAQAATVAN
jgi:NCAIR mutase (PurE)-related protein